MKIINFFIGDFTIMPGQFQPPRPTTGKNRFKKIVEEYIKHVKGLTVEPMNKPPKWTKIYPQGTQEGDEEQQFFISLSRHKDKFRSTLAIAQDTNLPEERVEDIIAKYYKLGMVFQNPENENEWVYWERCLEMLDKEIASIAEKDKKERINSVIKNKKSLWR
jgi:hypothetical protein